MSSLSETFLSIQAEQQVWFLAVSFVTSAAIVIPLCSSRSQINVLVRERGGMRSIILKQQGELAELRGQLKALIQMQSGGDRVKLK